MPTVFMADVHTLWPQLFVHIIVCMLVARSTLQPQCERWLGWSLPKIRFFHDQRFKLLKAARRSYFKPITKPSARPILCTTALLAVSPCLLVERGSWRASGPPHLPAATRPRPRLCQPVSALMSRWSFIKGFLQKIPSDLRITQG